MQTIKEHITSLVEAASLTAYPSLPELGSLADTISFPEQKFGDVATSVALRIGSLMSQNPREVAQKLIECLPQNEIVTESTIAGAGYINFRISPTALAARTSFVADFATNIVPTLQRIGAGKKVVMDYSHPNIGKPMGVHHLLSTIIGDSVKLSLRQSGHEVVADNFIGDMGTQFGKLIWAVKQWGDTAQIEADPITELQKLYVKFHIEADGDVTLDDAGRSEYRKLEEGDKENRRLWQQIIAWSKAEIQPIYDALGVAFDYMNGESFYEDKMEPLLERGANEGIFVQSEGALVCPADDPEQPPALLRKQDGATLYLTRDLARIDYWEKTWQPDIMVVVVDVAQQFAQKQLYAVSRKLDLTDADLVQVNFGRMRFADGGMSTRKGNILLLKDLIGEARERAQQLVSERSHSMSEEQIADAANKIAISSIKYNILMQNRLSDIVFDWSTMLNFEGNSAPYLLYTSTRIRSLLAKSESDSTGVDVAHSWDSPVEREVVLLLDQYADHLERSVREYKPSHLTNYIYLLAQRYNSLYNNLAILQASPSEREARLKLSRAVGEVLGHAFDCLGLSVPERM
jgi:arginyl-tRNA synthetase